MSHGYSVKEVMEPVVDIMVPPTEVEIAEAIGMCVAVASDVVRRLAHQRDALLIRVASLERQLHRVQPVSRLVVKRVWDGYPLIDRRGDWYIADEINRRGLYLRRDGVLCSGIYGHVHDVDGWFATEAEARECLEKYEANTKGTN